MMPTYDGEEMWVTAVGKGACVKPGKRVGVAVRVASEHMRAFHPSASTGACVTREKSDGVEQRRGTRTGQREVALAWHVAWGQRQVRVGVSVCLFVFELFVKGESESKI